MLDIEELIAALQRIQAQGATGTVYVEGGWAGNFTVDEVLTDEHSGPVIKIKAL